MEYPDGPRNRLSVFVRILLAIPILIIGALVTGSSQVGQADTGWDLGRTEALAGSVGLFLATALMILFRQKYPRWWFDWNLESGAVHHPDQCVPPPAEGTTIRPPTSGRR